MAMSHGERVVRQLLERYVKPDRVDVVMNQRPPNGEPSLRELLDEGRHDGALEVTRAMFDLRRVDDPPD